MNGRVGVGMKVLGICGSPVKGGNVENVLKVALDAASEEGAETELVTLAGKEIRGCKHCNWCVFKQTAEKFCSQDDDMNEIFPKLVAADALIVATPVYFARVSGQLANFIDRTRALVFGKTYRRCMKDKVGGAIAVGWLRHGGIETTLLSIGYWLLALEMLPVSVHDTGNLFGAGVVSSLHGVGKFDPEDRLLALKDDFGLRGAKAVAKRVVELTRIVKAGKEALGQK